MKKKFGFYKVFVECKWDQSDVVSLKNRTSVSYPPCITISVTAAAPISTSPLTQVSGSVQANNSDSAVGSPTIPIAIFACISLRSGIFTGRGR